MKIKSISDASYIEIAFCRDNHDAPQCRDDIAVNVELYASSGFSGKCYEVWLRRSIIDEFLNNLVDFEHERRGEITLSAWPESEFNPFEIRIRSIDSGQTMFVEIHLVKDAYAPDGKYVPFKVSAHFVFDPSMLLDDISEFGVLFQATKRLEF